MFTIEIQVLKETTICNIVYFKHVAIKDLFGNIPYITKNYQLISFHLHLFEDPKYISFNTPIIHNGNVLPKNILIPLLITKCDTTIPHLIKRRRDIVDCIGNPIIYAFKDGSIRLSDGSIVQYMGVSDKNNKWKYPGSIITALIPNQYSDLDVLVYNKLPPRTNITLAEHHILPNKLSKFCTEYVPRNYVFKEHN